MDSHNQLVWVREATEEEHEEGETVSGPLAQQYVRALGSNGGLDWVHVSQARGLAAGFDLASVAALPFSAKLEWFRSQVRGALLNRPLARFPMCSCRQLTNRGAAGMGSAGVPSTHSVGAGPRAGVCGAAIGAGRFGAAVCAAAVDGPAQDFPFQVPWGARDRCGRSGAVRGRGGAVACVEILTAGLCV